MLYVVLSTSPFRIWNHALWWIFFAKKNGFVTTCAPSGLRCCDKHGALCANSRTNLEAICNKQGVLCDNFLTQFGAFCENFQPQFWGNLWQLVTNMVPFVTISDTIWRQFVRKLQLGQHWVGAFDAKVHDGQITTSEISKQWKDEIERQIEMEKEQEKKKRIKKKGKKYQNSEANGDGTKR